MQEENNPRNIKLLIIGAISISIIGGFFIFHYLLNSIDEQDNTVQLANGSEYPVEYVTVCNIRNANVYHINRCEGLSNCRSKRSQISLHDAQNRHLRLCGYCENSSAIEHHREVIVSICNSTNAKSYHNSQCEGLNNCRRGQTQLDLSEAKRRGYRACGYCYK